MRLDGIERHSTGTGPLHRLDARLKLVAALILVVTIVSTPIGAWRALGMEGLVLTFLIGLAGIPSGTILRRWIGFLLLVGFLTVMVAPAHPATAEYGVVVVAASILIKSSLALLSILVLAAVTPFHKLLAGLRRLGVPGLLVATLEFMNRYRHVLVDELSRMATARRARTFDRRGVLSWGLLTGVIGILFLRTIERAERIHDAMVARGWQGTVHRLDD
jgi:cobalt/nickel transport system permease protein